MLQSKLDLPKMVVVKDNKRRVTLKDIKSSLTKKLEDEDETEQIKKDILFKIADNLFSKNMSLMDVLHKSVIDKVIDGKEYQLITRTSLINNLMNVGVSLSLNDQVHFKDLIRPIMQDFVDVKLVLKILEDLGIFEDVPPSNKHLDYNKLEGPAIRIFNEIIRYMKTNEIIDTLEFINKDNCDLIEVVGKDKSDTIQVIQALKLRDVLRSKDIINYGDDLNENFTEFLEVSPEYSDIIMIRKLKKAIRDIENCKYFRNFGESRRVKARNSALEPGAINPRRSLFKASKYYSTISPALERKNQITEEIGEEVKSQIQKKIERAVEDWKYKKLQSNHPAQINLLSVILIIAFC